MKLNPNYKLLIASTSTVYGSGYLDYLLEELSEFICTDEVLFIPYARPSGVSYDEYFFSPRQALHKIGIQVKGLHEFSDPKRALRESKTIFTGGGNTFLLLKTLYELDLMQTLKEVVSNGTAYIGTSAGSNITGLSIGTTNDMPIVYPPSFDALGFLPFNLNPHYLDPDIHSTHKGETRETRIYEFHRFNPQLVIGLREGSWLKLTNGILELKGDLTARLFRSEKEPIELNPGIIEDLDEIISTA